MTRRYPWRMLADGEPRRMFTMQAWSDEDADWYTTRRAIRVGSLPLPAGDFRVIDKGGRVIAQGPSPVVQRLPRYLRG